MRIKLENSKEVPQEMLDLYMDPPIIWFKIKAFASSIDTWKKWDVKKKLA